MYSIVSANKNLYAGTYGGIFKSSNGGYNWDAVNTGLQDSVVLALAANENSIFAGTKGDGLYKTDNWGESWYKANNGITCDTINSLYSLNDILFAGTYSKGIFRSTNSGANWTSCNSGFLDIPYVTSFTKNENTIYASNYARYPYCGLYKSTNYGSTWNLILGEYDVLAMTVYDNTIYAATYDDAGGNVLKSTNDGISWTNISKITEKGNPWGNADLRSLFTYNGKLFVGTYGKSIFSTKIEKAVKIDETGDNFPDRHLLMQNYYKPYSITKYKLKEPRIAIFKFTE